ncbi:MAG TPA: retroviral-like aspartic protease family protein, partial [Vicinamibacterales bacterium]|nr:retroviral-like aspartic protease family protein [Vicinamibacterales bacterium]
ALAARNRLDEAIDEVQAALAAAPGEGEFHHTLGGILQRLHRFDEAAEAFSSYVNLIPNRDRSDKVLWARAQVRFLRSFGRRRPLEMAGASPDMVYTIPFRLVRDKVTVEARVNGGGRMDFVLDTGSEMTVVSRQTARRSGIQPITWMQSAGVGEFGLRGLQVGRIDSLEIGSLKIRHVPCLIKNPPLGGLPTREADAFSPLALGLSVSIDYARRLVTIGRRVPRPPSELELPLWVYRLALVRGTVNAHPASFVVDTGGEVISISQATAGVIGMPPGLRRIPLKVYGTSGWDRDAFLLPGVDLAFHSIRLPRTPVVVLNLSAPSALLGFQLGGIVGHRFLSRYHVTIDLERSTLALASIG